MTPFPWNHPLEVFYVSDDPRFPLLVAQPIGVPWKFMALCYPSVLDKDMEAYRSLVACLDEQYSPRLFYHAREWNELNERIRRVNATK